jgi:hypothetical protein
MAAKPVDRPDIEQAIMNISDFIVRGKAARRNGAVRWYRINKAFVGIASALGSAGVSHPFLSIITGENVSVQRLAESLPQRSIVILVLGVALFFGIAIAQHYYKEKEVEKTAILSLSLAESYELLEREIDLALPYPEPLDQLVPIRESSRVLFKYYGNLMPPSEECQAKIKEEANKLIEKHRGNWNLALPTTDRR